MFEAIVKVYTYVRMYVLDPSASAATTRTYVVIIALLLVRYSLAVAGV